MQDYVISIFSGAGSKTEMLSCIKLSNQAENLKHVTFDLAYIEMLTTKALQKHRDNSISRTNKFAISLTVEGQAVFHLQEKRCISQSNDRRVSFLEDIF